MDSGGKSIHAELLQHFPGNLYYVCMKYEIYIIKSKTGANLEMYLIKSKSGTNFEIYIIKFITGANLKIF